MVMKVKELILEEYGYFCEGFILFIYLYLVVEEVLMKVLIDKKVIGIVYEIVQFLNKSLFLLILMSEVVGRMFFQIGV